MELSISVNEILYYAIENFLLCFFVSLITVKTTSIGDIAYNSPWYQMPRDERDVVEMIIRRSQRPREIKGMDVFVCSLETYLRVTRHNFPKKYCEIFDLDLIVEIFLYGTFSVDSQCYFLLHGVPKVENCLNGLESIAKLANLTILIFFS